jgi:hypothetical protein
MPKILLTLLMIFSFSLLASAQFSKGSLLVGGELAYSSYSTNENNTAQNYHAGNFNVSIGRAISENSVFGINLTYSPYSVSNYFQYLYGPIAYQRNGYGIGIFYRKYKALGKAFFLFGEAGAGYTFSNETGKDSLGVVQLSGSGNGGQLNVLPGIAYKVSNKFLVEITIPNIFLVQFNNTHTDYPNASSGNAKNNDFSISTSLNSNPLSDLGIGFRLIL